MKRPAYLIALCAYLLCPLTALAKTPTYGLWSFIAVHPEGDNDRTKNLQVALAITEELGKGGVPLSFQSRFQVSQERTKGSVTHRVSIYRGRTRIWKKKRTVPLEILDFTSDSINAFCDAYTKGLLPGDIVVFDFKLRGIPLAKTESPELFVQLGPREMWTVNQSFWYLFDLDCP